jgi:Predicted membrane protein, hemolysin III homolog
MKKEEKVRLPYVPTYGEEVANTVSHAVMLPLTLCLLPFAAVWTYLHDARPVLASVSVSVCVISIFLMLLASTLYHSMRPDSKHKAVFHKLDHIFIFVAIAGTYTPVALLVIGGWQGVFVTVLQWTAVLLGILYKTLARRSIPALSLTIYLVMGWTAIFFLPRLIRNASLPLLLLILLGGSSIRPERSFMRRRDSATTTWSGICLSTWRCCRIWRGSSFLSVDNEFAYMPGRNNADSFGGRDLGTVRNHKRGQYRE